MTRYKRPPPKRKAVALEGAGDRAGKKITAWEDDPMIEYGHLCHADRGYRHPGQSLSALHATAHG